jgi:hypothetical protein
LTGYNVILMLFWELSTKLDNCLYMWGWDMSLGSFLQDQQV